MRFPSESLTNCVILPKVEVGQTWQKKWRVLSEDYFEAYESVSLSVWGWIFVSGKQPNSGLGFEVSRLYAVKHTLWDSSERVIKRFSCIRWGHTLITVIQLVSIFCSIVIILLCVKSRKLLPGSSRQDVCSHYSDFSTLQPVLWNRMVFRKCRTPSLCLCIAHKVRHL